MDGSQKQTKAGGVTAAYNLVPAGALQRKRRFVAARFPVAPAGFSKGAEFTLGVDQQQAAAPSKQRDSAPPAAAPPPALLLTNKSLPSNAPGKQLQGVPRTDAIGNYFVLMKAGKDFSVYPLEASYTFKPYTKPSGLTIEEVEAGQRAPAAAAAAAGGGAASLLPKSVRLAMREQQATQAADKQLHDDAAPLLKDKLAELAVKYGNGSGSSSSRLVLHASEDEDGGSSDMDFGADDEEGAAKRKGPKADAARAAAAAKGKKGKGAASAAADDIPDDELAEDIYAGEEDELRPERPDTAADWEFVEDAQDDDLGMGGSDEEELEDDPGLRKELGIEEEEEEEEDPEKKEAELDKAAAEATAKAAAAAAAAAVGKAAEGGGGEDDMPAGDDEDDDEDLLEVDDDENFDEDYLDRLAKAADEDADGISPQGFKRRKQAAAASSGRYRSPAPGQRGATPPAAAAAAAAARDGTPGAGKRGATPPSVAMAAALAGQGSGRSATPPGGKRRTPPPGAAAAAAGRRATPPPQQQQQPSAKRKRSDAAAAGGSDGAAAAAAPPPGAAAAAAAANPGPPAWRWAAHQLDPQGVPTIEGVIEALRAMGPIPVQQLTLLNQHLSLSVSAEGKALLKQRLLQVAKVDMVEGVKCMVLKPRAP